MMTHVRAASGFALVAAIFLIVVLAALGLFAMQLYNAQQQSTTLSLLAARAQAAADTGIEYAANQSLKHGTCNNTTLALNQGALNGFSVNVTCTFTTHIISGVPYPVYDLTATATYGVYGKPEYVSRRAAKTVSTIP
jgi:MSHA biogenesis protein MshP